MKRWTDANGTPHVSFDTVEEITPESLAPVIKDLYASPEAPKTHAIPIIPEGMTRRMREAASALEKIADGWPELSPGGYDDYMSDAAEELRAGADALDRMMRPLQ